MSLLAASGDSATWVGSIGTWAVGLVAAVIAWVQYSHNRFRPRVRAYLDSKHRVVVRIMNEGAGAGSVEDVDLLQSPDPDKPLMRYQWEVPDDQGDQPTPIPFELPGLNTAQVVLKPARPEDITVATRARVRYGNGQNSGLVEIRKVEGTIFGSTNIPGVSPRRDSAQ